MKKKEISIKTAFDELEKITHEFETGDMDLESSIPKFKRGLELAQYLKKKLNEVENEIIEIKAKYDSFKSDKNSSPDNAEYDNISSTNDLFG